MPAPKLCGKRLDKDLFRAIHGLEAWLLPRSAGSGWTTNFFVKSLVWRHGCSQLFPEPFFLTISLPNSLWRSQRSPTCLWSAFSSERLFQNRWFGRIGLQSVSGTVVLPQFFVQIAVAEPFVSQVFPQPFCFPHFLVQIAVSDPLVCQGFGEPLFLPTSLSNSRFRSHGLPRVPAGHVTS